MLHNLVQGAVAGLAIATLGMAVAGWTPGQVFKNPITLAYGAMAGMVTAATSGVNRRTRRFDEAIQVHAEVVA